MSIKLRFLGAAENVTGSRYLIQANNLNILVDCGLYQERQFIERNWDDFPLPAAEIDAVLLTHAHLDHCGWLPRLFHLGFNGPIYATTATCELARIVLLDSAHIQMEDAEFKRKRHKRERRQPPHPEIPLYTIEDAQACEPLFRPIKYKQTVQIGPGIEACFRDAGHILGAAMIKLTITTNGQTKSILFSGDVGRCDKPILNDPTSFDRADYVIVESTYGNRTHKPTADIKDAFADVINSTQARGGNIIIPSFAIERAQEVLYYLNELLLEDRVPHLMAFLDSPMAVRVTEVFKNHPEMFDEEMTEMMQKQASPFKFPGLSMTATAAQSKAINQIRGTILIIAGSGMCNGGRVKHHLVNNISRPESTVLFVGYQANGTLGRHILEGAKDVRILGQKRPIKARIARINGFSAHADKNELFHWLSGLKNTPRQVFVTHGETEAAHHFAEYIQQKTGWQTSVPAYKDQVTLD